MFISLSHRQASFELSRSYIRNRKLLFNNIISLYTYQLCQNVPKGTIFVRWYIFVSLVCPFKDLKRFFTDAAGCPSLVICFVSLTSNFCPIVLNSILAKLAITLSLSFSSYRVVFPHRQANGKNAHIDLKIQYMLETTRRVHRSPKSLIIFHKRQGKQFMYWTVCKERDLS